MSPKTISSQSIKQYLDEGFLLLPDLVPHELCDRLINIALEQQNAKDGTFAPIPMPHKVLPEFLSMLRYPPVVAVIEQLVGGRASGLGGEFFYMRPGTPGFAIHQDNAYVQAPVDVFCSTWTALCDVDRENGALYFFSGSHKFGQLPIREREFEPVPGQNPNAEARECIMPAKLERIDIEVKKGSTVFLNSLLVHGSNTNRSNRFRYSFVATYIRKGQPYRPGYAQKRTEVNLYSDLPIN